MTVAELTQSDIMGARFREGIRARGGLVVGDAATDRQVLAQAETTGRTTQAGTDDRPGYIEIDDGEGLREIVIKQKGGKVVKLHPLLTYGDAKKMPFYERQIAKLQSEMDACDDEEQYLEILRRASLMEERMLRLAIPDLPEGLLDQLETTTLEQLRAAGERLRNRRAAEKNG